VTSKSKIDGLGDRLKGNQATDEDLRLLDEFRRSFSPAYESVIMVIADQLKLQPTGRPAKSTTSISEKLRRESIRLTQIQDIAGCRLVVSDILVQEQVLSNLLRVFPAAKVIDRRTSPSHGYRALHIIVDVKGRLIEIQLRTSLQHGWAELSEKISDIFDPAIKYGSGDETVRLTLISFSDTLAKVEKAEQQLSKAESLSPKGVDLQPLSKDLQAARQNLLDTLEKLSAHVRRIGEGSQ
jgi:putative GTP pyrophosphokinase